MELVSHQETAGGAPEGTRYWGRGLYLCVPRGVLNCDADSQIYELVLSPSYRVNQK